MKAGTVDTVVKALEKGLVPVMKKSPGFRDCYMMAGPGASRRLSCCGRAVPTPMHTWRAPIRDQAPAGIADRAATPALQMQKEES